MSLISRDDTIAPTTPLSEAPPVDSKRFLQGMRYFAAGCAVIVAQFAGVKAGLTATAVCSVTADPPRILVCVNRKVRAHELAEQSGALSINMLSKEQEIIARRFAGMVDGVIGEDRFLGADWITSVTGTPLLKDALFSFDCRVVETISTSTHSIFLCEVVDCLTTEEDGADPLLYFNGGFATLS
jgi:flavin reductase (DIM6/NTAB) family NADH-FMN oxidoreductase RutF